MRKSFKKAIACMLAVLMVVFSFPFTALAAPGDYAPDIDLVFNAVTNNTLGTGIGENFVNSGAINTSEDLLFLGVHGAPVDYDKKAGSLTLKADKANAFANSVNNDLFGEEVLAPLESDKTYGVGDVFSVTFLLKNVDKVNTLEAYLSYSDNIAPAGIGNIGTSNLGANRKYTFATADELTAKGVPISNWAAGFEAGTFLASQASGNYYTVNSILGDKSAIKTEDKVVFLSVNCSDASTGGQYTDITTTPLIGDIPYANPETGALDYDWSGNGMILETMFFKVTGEGPIKFDIDDKDGSKYGNHNGAQYVAINSDGTMPNQVGASYSPALDETDKGATKLTFMGTNDWNAPTECEHANTELVNVKEANCTTKGYTGDTKCTDCGEIIAQGTETDVDPTNHDYVATVTPATCGAAGFTTYTCSRCDDKYTEPLIDGQPAPATGNHTWDEGVVTTDPTEESEGVKTFTCSVCQQTKTEKVPPLAHTHTPGEAQRENVVDSTCEKEGSYNEVVRCTKCNEIISSEPKTIEKKAHTPGEAQREDVVDSTCEKEGSYNEVVRCTECNTIISSEAKTIEKKAHTPGEAQRENVVDSTCEKEGSYDEVVRCTECDTIISSEPKTIEKKAHTPGEVKRENVVEPTADKDGSYDEVTYCAVCKNEISRVKKTITANGVNVTVTASDLGSVEGLEYNANNLKYGTAYSVTAKPVAGAKFVGWEVNGKLISQEATLSGVAYTDITVTPVFTEDEADTISVIFYDKYANVVAHYDNVTVADFQAKMAKAIPVAPAYPGYAFEKWSKSDDEIKAIDKSQTIWAQYSAVETGYTVTTDATLTLPEGVENGKVPYDTEVTVSAEGATAWVIDGVTVGYGESYTFYVGSNVTVQPSFEAVTAEPKVTIIDTTKLTGSHKVNFLATKNVPASYELVDYGFVYGKDLADDELTIENVGKKGAAATAGAVKIVHGYTDGSDQFALNYGITAQQGTAIAKAYVVVKTNDGVKVIYSDASAYNYNA